MTLMITLTASALTGLGLLLAGGVAHFGHELDLARESLAQEA